MCQRARCSVCEKPSFVGCGRHVEQVLVDVPPAERCRCREERAQDPQRERSWIERVLGR